MSYNKVTTCSFFESVFLQVLNAHASLHRKMKFSIKDFFSKCDQIRSFLRIWSYLLKKFLMENFIFLCSASWKKIMLIMHRTWPRYKEKLVWKDISYRIYISRKELRQMSIKTNKFLLQALLKRNEEILQRIKLEKNNQ